MAELVAQVAVPATSQDGLQILFVVVGQRGHSTKEVVVHLLLVNEVFE